MLLMYPTKSAQTISDSLVTTLPAGGNVRVEVSKHILLTYYAEEEDVQSLTNLLCGALHIAEHCAVDVSYKISTNYIRLIGYNTSAGGNVRVEVSKHILLTYYAEEEVVQSLTNLLCGALHIAEHCAVDVSYKISTNYIRLIGYNTSSRWECQSRSEQTHITYLLCGGGGRAKPY